MRLTEFGKNALGVVLFLLLAFCLYGMYRANVEETRQGRPPIYR